MAARIGIVDTGVNPWHSHVRGRVAGCRVYVDAGGALHEDGDFRDPVGHGTAVAGVIRQALADAELFAVRVFDADETTYPSLVARGVLRAAAHGCEFINLSVSVPPGAGAATLATACAAAIDAGCVLVAAQCPERPDWLPAALPGVWAASTDDSLALDEVRARGPWQLAAPDRPRELAAAPFGHNLRGSSFACARALVHLARGGRRRRGN